MWISRDFLAVARTLVRMGNDEVSKIFINHDDLYWCRNRFICSIMGWWIRQVEVHQVECNSSNHFWFTVMYFHSNRMVYNFQICLWNRYWNSLTYFWNVHIINHAIKRSCFTNIEIKSLLGIGMYIYIYVWLALIKKSQLASIITNNLHTWNLFPNINLQKWEIKSSLFVGT